MKSRWTLVLLLASGVAGADPDEDLKFAQRLSARGLHRMANKILDDLVASGNPSAQRAGRYGKALLKKQEAFLARWRFLRALEEGVAPEVKREEVIALYAAAEPAITAYVAQARDPHTPLVLLAQLLQEYAEFLAGADYPESMAEEVAKLVEENRKEAEALFQRAIETYEKILAPYKKGAKKVPSDTSSPVYVDVTNAEFQKGLARFRWAMIYPKGTSFNYRMDEAIEEIDEFLQKHYDELFGAYAMLHLGRCYYEKAIRLGDVDDAEIAINYFETLYNQVDEVPDVKGTIDVLGRAFYWYARTCNSIASQAGALKKKNPVFYDNTREMASKMRQKLKAGLKSEWALRAMLEVAVAEAARGNYGAAVSMAGDALSKARFEKLSGVAALATNRLTSWVASVRGAGALDGSLLYQIGQSLSAQGRVGNAITFYQKAVTASVTDDAKIEVGYPSRLEIARSYRRDKRFFAAADVGWSVVEEFLASKESDESDFGLLASECCNTARQAWRQISEATKLSEHVAEYDKVTRTFREKFPGHKENSDSAFSEAMETLGRGEFEAAAKAFADISPSSRNYWRAQSMVPSCYRRQADADEAGAAGWHQKALESALAVGKLAEGKADPAAKRTAQNALLFSALSHASLEQWADVVRTVDEFLAAYPDTFPKRGALLFAKIHAHIALKQVDPAEATLALLKEKLPNTSYRSNANLEVYRLLRATYEAAESGAARQAMALRAAKLWEERVNAMETQDAAFLFVLGDVLRDAHQWRASAEAFTGAADLEAEPKRKAHYSLQAAMMQYRMLQTDTTLAKSAVTQGFAEARKLFTDVLVPDEKDQADVLRALSNHSKWPPKTQWDKIAKKPDVLLFAARVYRESSPAGLDGRWIAIRLTQYLQTFTRPVRNPDQPSTADKYVETWWDAAQLRLEISLDLAKSGAAGAKTAGSKGYSFARKLLFEHKKMDGEERRRAMQRLSDQIAQYK